MPALRMTVFHFSHFFLFQSQQVHAVLQGSGQDPITDPEAPDHAGQAGSHLPGTGHPHAVPGLIRKN